MDKLRLQFDVTPEALSLIDRLKDESGLSTRAELFRKAIKLYALILEEQKRGWGLVLISEQGGKEKQLAIL